MLRQQCIGCNGGCTIGLSTCLINVHRIRCETGPARGALKGSALRCIVERGRRCMEQGAQRMHDERSDRLEERKRDRELHNDSTDGHAQNSPFAAV